MARRYWIETLGCPKNQVDSDKLAGTLIDDGMLAAVGPDAADLVVVNTCAFIEAARRESIDTALMLSAARKSGAKLVLTGCMAERYGDELAAAMPEADLVAGFGVPVAIGGRPGTAAGVPVAIGPRGAGTAVALGTPPRMDLLNLRRPPATAPWAYVKVAEGCDRACGFCAIPSFRGPQRSRSMQSILDEIDQLQATEVVLVAQDLASYGKDDASLGAGSLVRLVDDVSARVERVRLLYLYPSDLTDRLIDAIDATGVHYFDLSLQHVSRPHLRRMRRWGDGDRFLHRIATIRRAMPDAAFRSNFIVGYPGETETDHDRLLEFVRDAQLDWCGFFSFSAEDGTYAAGLPDRVPDALVAERLGELAELQDGITATRRAALVGTVTRVLVDEPGVARSHREAPEIDGIISVPHDLDAGQFVDVRITAAAGPDLEAIPVAGRASGGDARLAVSTAP